MPNPGYGKLIQYYYAERKTLQEIANKYNVTRERVRQWMEKNHLPRRIKKPGAGMHPRFSNLDEYFDYIRNGGEESFSLLYRFILPLKKKCVECSSTKNLHIHHKKYPAFSLNDIQILCASCHATKHKKGNGHKTQLEICDKYIKGKNGIELAKEYNCHRTLIYRILHKWDIKTRPRFGRKLYKK